jgi:general secretion pathway protein A
MRQVAQRITGRYHLEPLGREETTLYVRHRMGVAGAQRDVFKPSAIRALYRRSRGIPRLINVVADRALLAAYTRDQRVVDGGLVARAAAEVFGPRRTSWRGWPAVAVTAGLAAFALATTNLWPTTERQPAPPATVAVPAPVAAAVGAPSQRSDAPNEITVAASAAQAPEQESPDSVTLATLSAEPKLVMDRDQAVGELLSLWGAAYDASHGDACEQAAREGLQCLVLQNGSLGELRRLNWPAIVTLIDERGAAHFVVIASLDHNAAHMLANGTAFDLPLAEVTYHWFGEHLLLWRPGIPQPKDLTPGMRDAGVLWLRETLARLAGEDPQANPSPLYDSALEQRVREFQRVHMLTVDGIVGARTQVAMIADLNVPGTPLLAAGQ